MDRRKGNNISDMVDKRLNDLFVEDDTRDSPKKMYREKESSLIQMDNENGKKEMTELLIEHGNIIDSPLNELKSHLLSLDWEITDSTIKNILIQLEVLKKRYKDDEYLLGLFRLMSVLTNYIKSMKSRSHPDSQRLLNSVYNAAEKIFLEKDISLKEKKEIVYKEVALFKQFKKAILNSKHEDKRGKGKAKMAGSPFGSADMAPHEAFVYALNEIKEVISAEFEALRTEIRLWREYEMQKDKK